MREVTCIRQREPALHKVWFNDCQCDLFVWRDAAGEVVHFQFCYGKPTDEHVLEWSLEGGLEHFRVDDGEGGPWTHASPVFVADGAFDPGELVRVLEQHDQGVPAEVVAFVKDKLLTQRATA